MRTFYFPVKADVDVVIPDTLLSRLPSRVALFMTAQLLHQYDAVVSQLSAVGKSVVRIKTIHTRAPGQLLGCNLQPLSDYSSDEFDATLYVGDGLFHPKALLWKNNKPSFMFNPFSGEEYEADPSEVELIRKKYNASLSAFHLAKVVGVIIPLKPGGQMYLKWALQLRDLYPDKVFVNLLDYNVDFSGLDNFPFCDVFVNTACPRISFDDAKRLSKPVVNLEDVNPSFYEKQLLSR